MKSISNKNIIYSNRDKYIREVLSSKENAIRFLVNVGIIDNEGKLSSVYK
jgi:hypothetical protein